MRGKILGIALSSVLMVSGAFAGSKFIVSFGDGGFSKYEIVDNTCYTYSLNYPKTDAEVSKLMNSVIVVVVQNAKKAYAKKADGFINIRPKWQVVYGKKIIYQVCGDIIKKK